MPDRSPVILLPLSARAMLRPRPVAGSPSPLNRVSLWPSLSTGLPTEGQPAAETALARSSGVKVASPMDRFHVPAASSSTSRRVHSAGAAGVSKGRLPGDVMGQPRPGKQEPHARTFRGVRPCCQSCTINRISGDSDRLLRPQSCLAGAGPALADNSAGTPGRPPRPAALPFPLLLRGHEVRVPGEVRRPAAAGAILWLAVQELRVVSGPQPGYLRGLLSDHLTDALADGHVGPGHLWPPRLRAPVLG